VGVCERIINRKTGNPASNCKIRACCCLLFSCIFCEKRAQQKAPASV
jgi:hypothetical protein